VIKGYVRVRHRILDLKQGNRDGVPHCGIVYEPKPTQTQLMSHARSRAGAILDPADAPPDVGSRGFAEAMAGWDPRAAAGAAPAVEELGLI